MNELVSIIVPIYNAEEYLDRCLQSIYVQSYKNIEVLLINDGSTDKSLNICEKYTKIDKRFVLINQENQGVSVTRQNGLNRAKGKYIMFIDSDDYVGTKYVESLYPYHNEDLVLGGYLQNKHNDIYSGVSYAIEQFTLNSYENKKIFLNKTSVCFVWSMCYKKSIIEKNNICFDKSVLIGEDLVFNYEYLLHCINVSTSNSSNYYKCDNLGSLVYRYYPNRIIYEQKISQSIENFLGKNDMQIRWYYWHITLHHYSLWKKRGEKSADDKIKLALDNKYFKASISEIRLNGTVDQKLETYIMSKYLFWVRPFMLRGLSILSKIKRFYKSNSN